VEGQCQNKTSTFFKLKTRKNQTLSFEAVAQRLGSALDPLMRLLDASGHELVFCEDTPGAGVDGRFNYKFAQGGEHLLELRDSRYEGGSEHRYRLRIGKFPLGPGPLPFIATEPLATNASALFNFTERKPGDPKPKKIAIPASVTGAFAKPGARHCYQFEAAKGARLVFQSKTRSLGSPCDLYLRLESSDGQKLAEAPLAGPDETSLTNTFKEFGSYRLIVEEAAQRGGPEYFYRLEIRPCLAGFALSVDTERLQAPSGGSAEIKILQERHDFEGPITLALEGLGNGFLLEKNILTPKTNATSISLKVPSNVEAGQLRTFRIIGRAENGFETAVSTKSALRKVFPHILWPPAELDGLMALGVTAK
jgi:hypothetical protein